MRNFGVRLLFGAVLLAPLAPLPAQRSFSGAAEIEQSLHKLNELGTILHIAAHPDDERTAVLAYFARGRHMRTAYLSLTRGDVQNRTEFVELMQRLLDFRRAGKAALSWKGSERREQHSTQKESNAEVTHVSHILAK